MFIIVLLLLVHGGGPSLVTFQDLHVSVSQSRGCMLGRRLSRHEKIMCSVEMFAATLHP
jgi:hypothetical protein